MFKGGGGGGGGGWVGFTPDFCENTILPKIFKIFGVLVNNKKFGGGVGKNVKSIFAKLRTEILAILWIFMA